MKIEKVRPQTVDMRPLNRWNTAWSVNITVTNKEEADAIFGFFRPKPREWDLAVDEEGNVQYGRAASDFPFGLRGPTTTTHVRVKEIL